MGNAGPMGMGGAVCVHGGAVCVCAHLGVRVCKQSCAHVEHVGVRRRDPPGCPHPAPPGTLTWSWGCHRDGIRCGGHPRDPSPAVGTGMGTGSALSPGHGGCRGVAAAPPRRTPQRREETRALSRRWLQPWLGRGLWPQISWRDHRSGAVLGSAFTTERAGDAASCCPTGLGMRGGEGSGPKVLSLPSGREEIWGFVPFAPHSCLFACVCGEHRGLEAQFPPKILPQTAPLSVAAAGWGAPRERTAFRGKKM